MLKPLRTILLETISQDILRNKPTAQVIVSFGSHQIGGSHIRVLKTPSRLNLAESSHYQYEIPKIDDALTDDDGDVKFTAPNLSHIKKIKDEASFSLGSTAPSGLASLLKSPHYHPATLAISKTAHKSPQGTKMAVVPFYPSMDSPKKEPTQYIIHPSSPNPVEGMFHPSTKWAHIQIHSNGMHIHSIHPTFQAAQDSAIISNKYDDQSGIINQVNNLHVDFGSYLEKNPHLSIHHIPVHLKPNIYAYNGGLVAPSNKLSTTWQVSSIPHDDYAHTDSGFKHFPFTDYKQLATIISLKEKPDKPSAQGTPKPSSSALSTPSASNSSIPEAHRASDKEGWIDGTGRLALADLENNHYDKTYPLTNHLAEILKNGPVDHPHVAVVADPDKKHKFLLGHHDPKTEPPISSNNRFINLVIRPSNKTTPLGLVSSPDTKYYEGTKSFVKGLHTQYGHNHPYAHPIQMSTPLANYDSQHPEIFDAKSKESIPTNFHDKISLHYVPGALNNTVIHINHSSVGSLDLDKEKEPKALASPPSIPDEHRHDGWVKFSDNKTIDTWHSKIVPFDHSNNTSFYPVTKGLSDKHFAGEHINPTIVADPDKKFPFLIGHDPDPTPKAGSSHGVLVSPINAVPHPLKLIFKHGFDSLKAHQTKNELGNSHGNNIYSHVQASSQTKDKLAPHASSNTITVGGTGYKIQLHYVPGAPNSTVAHYDHPETGTFDPGDYVKAQTPVTAPIPQKYGKVEFTTKGPKVTAAGENETTLNGKDIFPITDELHDHVALHGEYHGYTSIHADPNDKHVMVLGKHKLADDPSVLNDNGNHFGLLRWCNYNNTLKLCHMGKISASHIFKELTGMTTNYGTKGCYSVVRLHDSVANHLNSLEPSFDGIPHQPWNGKSNSEVDIAIHHTPGTLHDTTLTVDHPILNKGGKSGTKTPATKPSPVKSSAPATPYKSTVEINTEDYEADKYPEHNFKPGAIHTLVNKSDSTVALTSRDKAEILHHAKQNGGYDKFLVGEKGPWVKSGERAELHPDGRFHGIPPPDEDHFFPQSVHHVSDVIDRLKNASTNITDKDVASIRYYGVEGGSTVLNDAHWKGIKPPLIGANHSKRLNSILSTQKISEPKGFRAFQSVRFDPASVPPNDRSNKRIVSNPGFTSTTMDYSEAKAFSHEHPSYDDGTGGKIRHILQLHIPNDTHALYVGHHNGTPHHEVMMPRNTHLHISNSPIHEEKDVSSGTTYKIWHARVLHDGVHYLPMDKDYN